MRMRLKKNLPQRINDCKEVLLIQEEYEFYKLTEQERNAMRLNLEEAFSNDNPLSLELGCGKGSFALQWAKKNPNKNLLALEKLSNVIVVACEDALTQNLPNLRFMNCRAENLRYYLPDHCAEQILLNFSCPFPKKTYANRRLTSKNYLQLYKHILTENGIIKQKTDDLDFFEFSLQSYADNGYEVFDVTYDLPNDEENIPTEYEQKFRALGKKIYACKARLKK